MKEAGRLTLGTQTQGDGKLGRFHGVEHPTQDLCMNIIKLEASSHSR
jgi:hypothetical protein